ncbi:hypothetical protein C8Q78DRAFT_1063711 [Trametes maxima]|nr:hypothetical protein C8Q78DRAFT_1063711 [Trametes maxima]
MRRAGSTRAASPTNTTYSGISNYRTESYRPLPKASAQSSVQDPRIVARIHFDELSTYLASYLAKEPANSRTTARQKLTRLTRQQFQELSTDVYDELMRRKNNTSDNEVPFLPVRDDFHPKRNQARQKLATLPSGRFKDLSSDVYYELARRYPEFKEEPPDTAPATSPGSTYDDYPSPDFPRNGRASEDRGNDSGYGGSTPGGGRRPSEENGRRSGDGSAYGGGSSRRKPSQDLYGNERRRPSQDTTGLGRRPSESVSIHSESTSASNAQSATAGMGMIIPNKSTIAEEEIEVPYGRDPRDSSSTAIDRGRERSVDRDGRRGGGASDSEREAELSPRSPPVGGLGGLSGLSARLQAADGDEDEGGTGGRSGEDYYERMSYGRQSAASDRSAGASGIGARMLGGGGGRTSVAGEDQERMRREYEYKIATMQTRITSLERDLEDVQEREMKWLDGENRIRAMEQELDEMRRRAEEKSSVMLALQQELETLREERAREKDMAARRQQQDEDMIQDLQERCQQLEAGGGGGSVDAGLLDQLRSDLEGLTIELSDLSSRNDELTTARENDLVVIRDLDAQVKEYKRKYEQAKTELRSVKATSQLFSQPIKVDADQVPVARDGGLVDIHVTAFVSSIDQLLTAGRSNAPTRVLQPMKAVVNAVTAISDDVRTFERRSSRDRSEVDLDALQALRERLDATLSNLVAAAKTHAMGAGMSPVSLLDAAASHVSATVTELGKTILVRKATRAEQDQFASAASGGSATNGFAPSLRSVEELRSPPPHQRSGSSTSSRNGDDRFAPASPPRGAAGGGRSSLEGRRPPSNMSSSNASSPPPIFDQPKANANGNKSDSSAAGEGPDEAWAELKPYLEAQTESIVYAIQSVLSGVRSPTPSPTLNENLTQIITIVSSIVAVCKDNFPPGAQAQGEEILRELGEHANKLSEVQAQPEVSKESRQVMAKSSFAVANAMKGLMKL